MSEACGHEGRREWRWQWGRLTGMSTAGEFYAGTARRGLVGEEKQSSKLEPGLSDGVHGS